MGSRDLTYILLAVILVLLGRECYHRLYPRMKERWGSRWGVPYVSRQQEKMGLVLGVILLLVATVLTLLMERACPRIE